MSQSKTGRDFKRTGLKYFIAHILVDYTVYTHAEKNEWAVYTSKKIDIGFILQWEKCPTEKKVQYHSRQFFGSIYTKKIILKTEVFNKISKNMDLDFYNNIFFLHLDLKNCLVW